MDLYAKASENGRYKLITSFGPNRWRKGSSTVTIGATRILFSTHDEIFINIPIEALVHLFNKTHQIGRIAIDLTPADCEAIEEEYTARSNPQDQNNRFSDFGM